MLEREDGRGEDECVSNGPAKRNVLAGEPLLASIAPATGSRCTKPTGLVRPGPRERGSEGGRRGHPLNPVGPVKNSPGARLRASVAQAPCASCRRSEPKP